MKRVSPPCDSARPRSSSISSGASLASVARAEDFCYIGIKEVKLLIPAAGSDQPAVRASYDPAKGNSCVEGYYCSSSGYESDGNTPTCFEYYYYTVCGEKCRSSTYCGTNYNGRCKIWRRDASCD